MQRPARELCELTTYQPNHNPLIAKDFVRHSHDIKIQHYADALREKLRFVHFVCAEKISAMLRLFHERVAEGKSGNHSLS